MSPFFSPQSPPSITSKDSLPELIERRDASKVGVSVGFEPRSAYENLGRLLSFTLLIHTQVHNIVIYSVYYLHIIQEFPLAIHSQVGVGPLTVCSCSTHEAQ